MKKVYLLSIATTTSTTQAEYFYMTYDSSTHLLTSFKRIQITNSPSTDTTNYQLIYSQGRVSNMIMTDRDGGGNGVYGYHYNSKGWLDTVWVIDGTSEAFKYNNKGEPTDVYEFNNGLTVWYHSTFAYDSSGNLSTEVDSSLYDVPLLVQTTNYTQYDNAVNYIKTINGYPPTWSWDNNFGIASSFSPNNNIAYTFQSSPSSNDPNGIIDPVGFSYEYNEAGLPARIVSGPFTTILTYQKYK
jgi:hypothetical protein